MAPKKQKQSLADFLADETTGKVDWADDFDDLPAAPISRPDRGIPQRGSDWLASMPDRADRDRSSGLGSERQSYPAREELPLPTQPPYTAFIGNLSFDVSEEDIGNFFAPDQTISIRLVTGGDGRPKGFGYTEFETLDGLKNALTKSGSQLAGRTARVSVAEPREAKGPAFSSVAEEATQWRRAGPLPPSSDGASGPGRRGGDRPGYNRFESSGGSSGFDNMDVGPGGGRSGFGSKFAPSAPREPRRNVEPLEPSQGDNASDWRTGKPVSEIASPVHPSRRPSASPAAAAGADGGRAPSFRRHGDATEVDEKYANQERLGFGSKFVATPPDSPSVQKRSGFGFDRRNKDASTAAGNAAPTSAGDGADTWRSARRPSANGPASNGASKSAEATAAEPAQRKKLELKPRSTPVGGDAPTDPASTDKGNNPFGNARPVDASERQREIEEKMAQREQERKEEDRKRREKQKAEREKMDNNVPTGPKADRSRNNATRSNSNSNEKAVNGEGAKSPTKAAAAVTTPKQPAPTGAWGGGRKPSGALAGKQQEGEQEQEASSEQSTKSDVDNLTNNVEAVSVKDA